MSEVISGIRTTYRALFSITMVVGILLMTLDAFGAFGLKHVNLDGAPIELEASKALGLAPGSSVFRQSLDATAIMMCRRTGIGSARVEVAAAHTVNIRTNLFETEFLVYDAQESLLRGLTAELVVAPLNVAGVNGGSQELSAEVESAPMFVGLKKLKLFERPSDFRLETMVADLQKLEQEDENYFAALSAIDCSDEKFLIVSFRNTNVTLLTDALTLGETIMRFQTVIANAEDLTKGAAVIDMRFDGLMIIPEEKQKNSGDRKFKSKRSRRNGNG